MRRLGIALCLAAATAPAPAASGSRSRDMTAQPRWERRVQVEQRTHFEGMRTYAACMAQRREAEIEAVLSTPLDSREHMRLLRQLVSRGECIRGGMEMSTQALRGAFAERLLTLRRPSPEGAAGAPAEPEWSALRAQWAVVDRDGMDSEDEALAHAFWVGRCAVRRDAPAVLTFLRTDVGTARELTGLRAITPTLAACAQGSRPIDVDRFEMRAALAEAAYAILAAGRPVGGGEP